MAALSIQTFRLALSLRSVSMGGRSALTYGETPYSVLAQMMMSQPTWASIFRVWLWLWSVEPLGCSRLAA